MNKAGREPASHWIEKPVREVGGQLYRRYVVRTHLIRPGERLEKSLAGYLTGQIGPDDIVALGEKIVAIAEGRAVLVRSVQPRRLARFLARHVRPLGYGLGLRRAETMEMAIREAGSLRIIAASLAGAFDRISGRSGDFYRVAGRRVAAIDGPGPTTIPPYDRYIVLAPAHSEAVIQALSRRFGCQVAVVDVNDVGSEVLAASSDLDVRLVQELMRDNPMGQGAQGTPVAVLRPGPAQIGPDNWPLRPASVPGGWANPLGGTGDGGLGLSFVGSGDHEGRLKSP
ncbi:MAG: coenzyme F420-0:L-glutamate ligase [Thermaerobacter sp.]|nr:coenzyme F420-0:L-glutamate ligase [Thermaerobacter sp.]